MSELIAASTQVALNLEVDTADEQWSERALCAQTDPEAFFPEQGGSTREAKAICRRCPVAKQCLTHALEHDERFGVWGGMSERERRRIKHGTYPADKRVTAADPLEERLAG
jgi:WhiB family redox-sensing transcriptional regulator